MATNHKYNEELAFLRENAYAYYSDRNGNPSGELRDRLFLALFHSLDVSDLRCLYDELLQDPECPTLLQFKIKGVLKGKAREVYEGVSTATLLRWYSDMKSGKVTKAMKELMARFSSSCAEDQEAILKAFLYGGKKEMEWAGRKLRANWVRALEPLVAQRWKATHNQVLAYTVLRHMPDDFVLEEQEALSEVTSYSAVCARIGNLPNFHIDAGYLDTPEYLYVAAKLNPGKTPTCELELFVDDLLDDYFEEVENVPQEKMGIILWSLGKLGLSDTIMRINSKFVS